MHDRWEKVNNMVVIGKLYGKVMAERGTVQKRDVRILSAYSQST